MKTIIVYYSLDGNVKLLSETIAQELQADLLPLRLKKEIKSDSFMKYFWGGKQVVMKELPELEEFDFNPVDYDLIILGTPVWAASYTPALRSFLEKIDLSSKKVAFFCSHEGGSGLTITNLKNRLRSSEVISSTDFLAPLKKGKEAALEKARGWAKTLNI
jgi:flavodoxin